MTATAPHVPRPRHRHSPRVRRLAREAGIDPDTVAGTGPNGRVRPADVVAGQGVGTGEAGVAEAVTYVGEIDLGGLPDAVGDRHAVVAAVVYALLHAVRRRRAVTDVEVESDGMRVLIPGAHDLTRVAIADRLWGPGRAVDMNVAGSPTELIVVDVADVAGDGGLLRVRRAPSGCVLSAVIGPTSVRAVTRSGPAGLPTIEFRPLALLAVSTAQPELADSLGPPWRLGDP